MTVRGSTSAATAIRRAVAESTWGGLAVVTLPTLSERELVRWANRIRLRLAQNLKSRDLYET